MKQGIKDYYVEDGYFVVETLDEQKYRVKVEVFREVKKQ